MFFYIYKVGNNKNISAVNAFSAVLNIILITLIFIVPIDLYYENGLTMHEIAKRYHVSQTTVSSILKDNSSIVFIVSILFCIVSSSNVL